MPPRAQAQATNLLKADMPGLCDAIFSHCHDTTNVGCEQCHVFRGSNAGMVAQFSAQADWPDTTCAADGTRNGGTQPSADSRLLKVDNRGTCQRCHDPTRPFTASGYSGPTPAPGAP
jgi:hypothetical protein